MKCHCFIAGKPNDTPLIRSKKSDDYSPLTENLSMEKRKRDGAVNVGDGRDCG